MLDKKKLVILIVVVVVLLAAAGAGYYWMANKDDGQAVPGGSTGDLPGGSGLPGGQPGGEIPASDPVPVVSQEYRDKTDLQNTAKFFVEMLGSYSSDARFQNIIDLKPLMTNRMENWADDFITKNLPGLEEQNERLTTQVLKIETTSYTGQRATVLAETRRQKIDDQGSRVYNQLAEVDLVKSNNSCLVDEVNWR